jgi:hypothetical protein
MENLEPPEKTKTKRTAKMRVTTPITLRRGSKDNKKLEGEDI